MLANKDNDSQVRDWQSEHMQSCIFCDSGRRPDPNNVIVSMVKTSGSPAICELCVKGAVIAVTREYRRLADRKPPNKHDPKARRTMKHG